MNGVSVTAAERLLGYLKAPLVLPKMLRNKLTKTTRIAVIGSPRSGNTWVRMVIAQLLDAPQMVVNAWKELPRPLPPRCTLQIHWYREPVLQALLHENDFQIVVIARHPLDVLVSVLHFIQFEPKTARWLEGNVEIPKEMAGSTSVSDVFKKYTLSWGAENLLSISYQWWHDPKSIRIRYEDLVANQSAEFRKLIENLRLPSNALEKILAQMNLRYFQSMANHHGWQGQPGLWKLLIPGDTAWQIYKRHQRVFETLGYGPPRSTTTPEEALANWEKLRAK
jgi:hypothetical protein